MSLEDFALNQLQDLVLSGKTRTEKWRREQLHALSNLMENHQQEILNALNQDLGKPATEAFFEIIAVKQEIKLAQKHLSNWMRAKQIKVPISLKLLKHCFSLILWAAF